MSAETVLRPTLAGVASAAPTLQLLRRRSFGKIVRVDLAAPLAPAEAVATR